MIEERAFSMPNHLQMLLRHEVNFPSANNHPMNHQPSVNNMLQVNTGFVVSSVPLFLSKKDNENLTSHIMNCIAL